jgi:hypothetical protein
LADAPPLEARHGSRWFSPDERYLGAITGDHTIEVFSTTDWSRVYSSPAHFEHFEFSPDGGLIAMGPQSHGDRVLVVEPNSFPHRSQRGGHRGHHVGTLFKPPQQYEAATQVKKCQMDVVPALLTDA